MQHANAARARSRATHGLPKPSQKNSRAKNRQKDRRQRVPSFYEFFAGAGMAREGLGKRWNCLFANEFDLKKTEIYNKNWPTPAVLTEGDVGKLKSSDVPGHADLAWASFPCQDLSLAGAGAGLRGDRSGTFWPFWRLMQSLIDEGR